MKNGFTLVELSIVLVIIGLLIGGILVGQSLIDSAKVNSGVSQFTQIDSAVTLFKSKYRQIPGDSPAFGGDGDLAIDLNFNSANYLTAHGCEMVNFWNHIFPSDYPVSSCSAPGSRAITSGAGKNVPESKLGRSGSFIAVAARELGTSSRANTVNPENYYTILGPEHVQTIDSTWYRFLASDSTNSALKPAALLSFDRKMDDAIAHTGNVTSGAIIDHGSRGVFGFTPLAACSIAGAYQIQNDDSNCTPMIRVGFTTGSLL